MYCSETIEFKLSEGKSENRVIVFSGIVCHEGIEKMCIYEHLKDERTEMCLCRDSPEPKHFREKDSSRRGDALRGLGRLLRRENGRCE